LCGPRLGPTDSPWTDGPSFGRTLRGHRVRLGSCAAPFLGLFLSTLCLILGAIASRHLFDELVDPGGLYICNWQAEQRKRQEKNALHQPALLCRSTQGIHLGLRSQRLEL
jgi:hypothetical protein